MKKIILIIPILLLSKSVKVDEILTDTNTFRLDTFISYQNIKRTSEYINVIEYETQNGDFITIPSYFGNNKSNQDYINYGLTLRYGFNKNIELFSSINLYTSDTHYNKLNQFETKHDDGFNLASMGITYQLKEENKTPSLLLGTSIDLIDKTKFKNNSKNMNFKGYSFFTTTYYTVDPIVFFLKASYRVNLKKKYKEESIKNSNQFSLSPQIYFAVNPYTSLSTGIRYSYKNESKIDGEKINLGGSNITYLLGMSYEINTKSTLNIDIDYSNNIDISQNSLSLGISYVF